MSTGVRLRAARPDDAPFLLALRSHPAVAPFMGRRDQDEDALSAELVAADHRDAGRLVVCDGDARIGGLAWRIVSHRSRIVDLSEIALVPEARGRGLGAEVLRRACRLLVDEVDAHRLQLEAYGFNHAAHRTFERAGFRREGTRRRAYWARDAWQDGVLYGVLAEELAAGGPEPRVRGLGWLGTRTDRVAETVALFRDVLELPVVHETPTQVVLALPDGGLVEVFATDHPGKDHFTTGPVAGLVVDDVDDARERLERAGVELLGPAAHNRESGDAWAHFRGPDGNVYELVSRSR